jgi:RNA polymerase sigma-70 factor (ECF subfamily)
MPDEVELGRLLKDASQSPEGNLLHAEQHHLLHQAVLRIPAQLRIVLVLHDMEELTTEQVAQILDLQPGTVRVRLHRARLSVRKEMSRILDRTNEQTDNHRPARKKAQGLPPRDAHRPTECHELFVNLSEYLDGRVEPRTCDQMRRHIEACPACVAFLRDLRGAIDRCRSLKVRCDSAVAPRLRSILTQEYLRLLGLPGTEKVPAVL